VINSSCLHLNIQNKSASERRADCAGRGLTDNGEGRVPPNLPGGSLEKVVGKRIQKGNNSYKTKTPKEACEAQEPPNNRGSQAIGTGSAVKGNRAEKLKEQAKEEKNSCLRRRHEIDA